MGVLLQCLTRHGLIRKELSCTFERLPPLMFKVIQPTTSRWTDHFAACRLHIYGIRIRRSRQVGATGPRTIRRRSFNHFDFLKNTGLPINTRCHDE